jgi:hypothetical protein
MKKKRRGEKAELDDGEKLSHVDVWRLQSMDKNVVQEEPSASVKIKMCFSAHTARLSLPFRRTNFHQSRRNACTPVFLANLSDPHNLLKFPVELDRQNVPFLRMCGWGAGVKCERLEDVPRTTHPRVARVDGRSWTHDIISIARMRAKRRNLLAL